MISQSTRPANWLSVIGVIILQTGVLSAQPPRGVLTLPDGPLPTPLMAKDSPAAREAISRVFQGEPHNELDHPIPEGLLDLINGNRSVLSGSSLDPDQEFLPKSTERSEKASPEIQSIRDRRRVAEMLLKTARLLDKIDPNSENQLVNQMQNQAVQILQGVTVDQQRIQSRSNTNQLRLTP